MKKFICLTLMMVCCFGFIGFVDAATTYEKTTTKGQTVELGGNYVENDSTLTKTVSEFVTGDFYYSKNMPTNDKGKFKLSDGTKMTSATITAAPKEIVGLYTLVSSDLGATSETAYLVQSYVDAESRYVLKEMKLVVATTVKAGTSYKFDSKTGKYTLVDPKDVAFGLLKDKYICKGGVDTTCQYMYEITAVDTTTNKATVNTYSYKKITTTTTSQTTSQTTNKTTANKNNVSDTSNKNGTVQTTQNPNTGISDYIMYLVPIALAAGSVIVMKRKHA